jgi:hypothetical protein
MKVLSVLHRMVENKGRTVIRVSEWFLCMRAEQEKGKSKAAPFGKANPKGCATQDRLNRVKGAPPARLSPVSLPVYLVLDCLASSKSIIRFT